MENRLSFAAVGPPAANSGLIAHRLPHPRPGFDALAIGIDDFFANVTSLRKFGYDGDQRSRLGSSFPALPTTIPRSHSAAFDRRPPVIVK